MTHAALYYVYRDKKLSWQETGKPWTLSMQAPSAINYTAYWPISRTELMWLTISAPAAAMSPDAAPHLSLICSFSLITPYQLSLTIRQWRTPPMDIKTTFSGMEQVSTFSRETNALRMQRQLNTSIQKPTPISSALTCLNELMSVILQFHWNCPSVKKLMHTIINNIVVFD